MFLANKGVGNCSADQINVLFSLTKIRFTGRSVMFILESATLTGRCICSLVSAEVF